jgi:hypothetical protein
MLVFLVGFFVTCFVCAQIVAQAHVCGNAAEALFQAKAVLIDSNQEEITNTRS